MVGSRNAASHAYHALSTSFSDSDVKPGRLWSTVWRYFEVIDHEARIASCNKCGKVLSYKATVTNLRKHYETMHDCVIMSSNTTAASRNASVEHTEDDKITDHEDTGDSDLKPGRRSSKIWQYFKVIDKANQSAICNKCGNVLSYRGTVSNLRKHYETVHGYVIPNVLASFRNDSVEHADEENIDDGDTRESGAESIKHNRKGHRAKKSIAWKYFKKTDLEKRIAKCNLCYLEISYNSTVSNLVKHVIKKHGLTGSEDTSTCDNDDFEGMESDDDDDFEGMESDDNNMPEKSRALAWLYFKCLDPVLKISKCLICKKRLSNANDSNLISHLRKKHPQLKLPEEEDGTEKQVIISEDGQLYEIETNDNKDEQSETEAMDTVYLEDHIVDEPIDIKPRMKRKNISTVKMDNAKKYLLHKNTKTEEVSHKEYERKEDSLDHFAKYVTSLLRQLPKNISDQLQMNFIKEILNAKITLSQTVTVVPSNSYSITVTDQEANQQNDVVDEIN